jgi:hypothetical protein
VRIPHAKISEESIDKQARVARVGRNCPCPCNSAKKYKRCCLERDEVEERGRRLSKTAQGLFELTGRLAQFERYAAKVFSVPKLLAGFKDGRRDPDIPTFDVANSLFHAALLRIPSTNALEGDLKEADFQRLIGYRAKQDEKAFSADVIANVLDKLELSRAREAIISVNRQAERNKVFREGWHGSLRFVALDGWEPFCSYHRHCPHCLTRQVERKLSSGEVEKVVQYYHRYVVAMLIDGQLDVTLDIEPVMPADLRDGPLKGERHEGELTAAKRLIRRVKRTYPWVDVMVGDGLYSNGPFLTLLRELKMGAVLIAKKDGDEPLKEALSIWGDKQPDRVIDDEVSGERIELWDVKDLDTLDSYKGKIRVVRGRVLKQKADKPSTWCMLVTGKADKLSPRQTLAAARGRWHIENTGFNQWVSHWNLNHVFRHTANALSAILLIWMLAFNLLQLFIYRRLKRARRPQDPTDTIRHIVEVMLREVASISRPIPWQEILAFI